MLVGLGKTGGTALGRKGDEPVILVNKPGHFIAHHFNSEQTQSLSAPCIE